MSTAPTSSSSGTFRAVFFDLDDTLVLTHAADRAAHDAVRMMLQKQAPDADGEAVVRSFISGFTSQPWDPLNKIDVTEWRASIWDEALKSCGIENIQLARTLQDCFDTERMLAFQWATGVEELIKDLKNKGIKIGLITNGHAKVQRSKIRACKADELFEVILVGGEELKEKPHEEIFIKACEIIGCKTQEAVMVGDNLITDIQGGINAGFLATVWVNIHNLKPSIIPSYTICSIDKLRDVLENICYS